MCNPPPEPPSAICLINILVLVNAPVVGVVVVPIRTVPLLPLFNTSGDASMDSFLNASPPYESI